MLRHISLLLLLIMLLPGAAFAPPQPPAIMGILFVHLSVSDMQAATMFYGRELWLIGLSSGCYISNARCFWINDFQHLELAHDSTPAPQNRVDAIGIQTKDAAGLREYFLSRGLHPGSLSPSEGGRQSFEISDPEGHRLVFESVGYILESILSQAKPPVSHQIIHAGFVVHDRAAEDKFYKDILGFHMYWDGGMKDHETDWVDMQVPDGTDWLEYMLNVPPSADKKELGVMNHIALGVPDIRAARAQLLKNGMKLTEESQVGRDGKWQLNVYDPDDTRVEFMEFAPVQKPCCSDYTGPHPKP